MYNEEEIARIQKAKEAWETTQLKEELDKVGERKKEFTTMSGIPVKRVYTPVDLNDKKWSYIEKAGFPGEYPFTRGITATMYRSNLWGTFQYAGFGTSKSTNEFYKYMLEQGAQQLVVALNLPTQMGYDSDNPLCRGEVSKVGVPIDSLDDFETLFDGIPIEKVVINTTANAIGPLFFAWIAALAEKRGIAIEKLTFGIQNDILKEYVARGTYIFPVRPALKFACDLIEYSARTRLYGFGNQYCGYHMREAGANAIQEVAFTLANAAEYIKELISRGLSVDKLPRVTANMIAGMDFFEEICKFRALRRTWAKMMKEKFNAKNPRAMTLALIGQSQATLFTAQQPLNNIVRGTVGALVQALSGFQAGGVPCMDEALAIPSPESARVAIRTEQIIAHETGVADTVDPLAGSYYVETLTDEIEDRAIKLFEKVEAMGGAIPAIEQGFMEAEIAKSAYDTLKQVESGERVWVGVNKYQVDEAVPIKLMKVDPMEEERQIERLKRLRRERDNVRVKKSLEELKETANEGVNLVLPVLAAVKSYATTGEICDVLRDVWGEYKRPRY